jgi:hypothetical protein
MLDGSYRSVEFPSHQCVHENEKGPTTQLDDGLAQTIYYNIAESLNPTQKLTQKTNDP